MSDKNREFLDHISTVISETPDHPLRFLLNEQQDRVMTMSAGKVNLYDPQKGVIFEGTKEMPTPMAGTKPSEIADQAEQVSVSAEAWHLNAKKHLAGEPERFAVGIAEDNRSHAHAEKSVILDHEAINIGGVPVVRESAEKWEQAGLLAKGTVEKATADRGWTGPQAEQAAREPVAPDRKEAEASQKGEQTAPNQSKYEDVWAAAERREAERAEQKQNQQAEQERRQRR